MHPTSLTIKRLASEEWQAEVVPDALSIKIQTSLQHQRQAPESNLVEKHPEWHYGPEISDDKQFNT